MANSQAQHNGNQNLAALLARLSSTDGNSQPSPQYNSQGPFNQPTVSSPIFSPGPSGPVPTGSGVLSPNLSMANSPAPASSDHATGLLNLLNVGSRSNFAPSQAPLAIGERPANAMLQSFQSTAQSASRTSSGTENLVATFQRKPTSSTALHTPPIASTASGKAETILPTSSEHPQAMLLRLLQHGQSSSPASNEPNHGQKSEVNRSPASIARSSVASLRNVSNPPSQREADYSSNPNALFSSGSPAASRTIAAPAPAAIFSYANPFEQLERSSPLNRAPKQNQTQQTPLQPYKDVQENVEPSSVGASQDTLPKQEPDVLSPGISKGTVSDAITEVAEQVKKEVEQALAPTENAGSHATTQAEASALPVRVFGSTRDAKQETAATVSSETAGDAVPAAVHDTVLETNDNVADSWESAEAEEAAADSSAGEIHVFNFPMKPFTSIDVNALQDQVPHFREKTIMEIGKHKKDFDQMDRQLVAASKNFIVWATLKPLGFRVVRQESGHQKPVFKDAKERVFNISICSASTITATEDSEAILGTGVNGSIFWTSVLIPSEDRVDNEDLEQAGFIFPAAPAHDDNTSGGQLKTRAKTSTRHPEFFAVGRGKSIHLVWPKIARSDEYTDQTSRICDSEKYLKERSLKIATGKAGKDFAFSADDTVIVSLDKAGRIRFWDIRKLMDGSLESPTGSLEAVTVRTPILDLQSTSSGDRSWPTSIFFLDKERPLHKGIALRYLVVGQKQNHTLQLWDLGLGKAVQELNLPHDNESDAICTVQYHAKSGIMVVGHPTRNSIYFIHISAPKYTLPAMNQAKYLNSLADPKSTLPKPESTAIMSGIREYSLGSKGKLRSLHLLDEHLSAPEAYAPGDPPLFELYVMHSKGLSLISIYREDLGWTKEYRVVNPIDAAATGAITVSTLRPSQSVADSSTNGDSRPGASNQGTLRDGTKQHSTATSRAPSQTPEQAMRASTLAKVESKQDAERAAIMGGAEKPEKKKKKRSNEAASQVSSTTSRAPQNLAPLSPSPSYAQAAGRSNSPAVSSAQASSAASRGTNNASGQSANADKSGTVSAGQIDSATLDNVTEKVTKDIVKSLDTRFDDLYKRIDDDKRVLEASGAAKQEAILRLVSSTLSENLDKSFSRHIKEAVTSTVLPSVTNSIQSVLGQNTGKALQQVIKDGITHEIRTALPGVIGTALREPDTLRIISDLVAGKVTQGIDAQLKTSFQSILPNLTNAVSVQSQQASAASEKRLTELLHQAAADRQSDGVKIEQLTKLVHSLTTTVQAMQSSQGDLLQEIQSLQQQLASQSLAQTQLTDKEEDDLTSNEPEDPEYAKIRNSMETGNYEEGTISWLQSSRQAELFDNYFVRYDPNFVQRLSPLVTLSVAAATTSSMNSFLPERLAWLEAVLNATNPTDPEICEVVPQIMDVISARLSAAYMHVAGRDESHKSPALQRMQILAHKTQQFKNFAEEAIRGGSSRG